MQLLQKIMLGTILSILLYIPLASSQVIIDGDQSNDLLLLRNFEQIERYCNTRFDYCLDFPKNILDKIDRSVNGDGITLSNSEGTIRLHSWGQPTLGSTLKEEMDLALAQMKAVEMNPDLEFVLLKDNYFELKYTTEDQSVYMITMHHETGDFFFGYALYVNGEDVDQENFLLRLINNNTEIVKN